jgi:methyl-accepting chemotaxis protein
MLDTQDIVTARIKVASSTAAIEGYRTINEQIRQEISRITEDARRQSQNASTRAKTILIILTVCAGIMGAVLAAVLAGRISKPIIQVSRRIVQIAQGDLTSESIKTSSGDEVGEMVHSLNQMMDNLRSLIKRTKDTSEQLASSAEEFSASAEETSRSVQQVSSAVQNIAGGTNEQAEKAQEAARMVEGIAGSVDNITDKISVTMSYAEQANSLAGEGLQALQNQENKMKQNFEASERVGEVTTELLHDVRKVGNILEAISSIAAQTNLLALNAAIEAARRENTARFCGGCR